MRFILHIQLLAANVYKLLGVGEHLPEQIIETAGEDLKEFVAKFEEY